MAKIFFHPLTAICLIATFLVSCDDFLNQDPQTAISTEQVFADLNKVQAYLDGVYFNWKQTRVNRRTFFTMLGTDEIQQGEYQCVRESYSYYQGAFDRYDGGYDAWDNQYTAEIWNVRYPVVGLSTEALMHLREKEASATKDDSAKIKSLIAQASFYRACVLFELARYWGKVPVPNVANGNIVLSGRKPLSEVYGLIESDLKATEAYSPVKPDPSNVRIPTVWAAKAMLAKIYMYAQEESGFRDLSKAKGLLQEIIEKGGYDLITPYSKLWTGEDNTDLEVIYKLAFNNIWPDTNELQWYTGSRAVSMDRKCYMGGYDLALPTEYCYKDISAGGIWEQGDQRREESIRYNFNE
ncbi:MAG: RagB/SusD family nutrient uptake outer membrane protein, partial [Candidatus Symbiothrix sp.]|nr:RagB/SusD family nutrient uptake outer membrane protein [Candidatus Symbiothrix sp.]